MNEKNRRLSGLIAEGALGMKADTQVTTSRLMKLAMESRCKGQSIFNAPRQHDRWGHYIFWERESVE